MLLRLGSSGNGDVLLLGHALSLVNGGYLALRAHSNRPHGRDVREGCGAVTVNDMPTPDVVLLTKADCHLCTAARAAVERVTADLGLGWSEQSIDADPQLRERYAEEIPVVLVNGIQRDFWKIDEDRLTRTLKKALEG
ncbi:hypothetical protein GCM10010052_08420 [Paenarthrobacter histidinolovorans]|nr:hypothetical protein GCM10010052_08420 [Paenarthrobacter histidinolovorans]